ncbi:MAG TPA: hypothetical protein VFW07_05790 [Parafilimonas sp.]|nr:hypothetical protein [Parafilimonas sp.]
MRKLFKITLFGIVLLSLESCITQKQLAELWVNVKGIENVCISRPINYSFDANKNKEISVQISLSNTNSWDVTGSLNIDVHIYDKTGAMVGLTQYPFYTGVNLFPHNQANAYTSPFFAVDWVGATDDAYKIGEKYKIQVRKYYIGANHSTIPFTSCSLYEELITLK